MLQFLCRKLPTWKYWVTLGAVFVPIWISVLTLAVIVWRHPRSLSLDTPLCSIHYEMDKTALILQNFNQKLILAQLKLKDSQTKIKILLEQCGRINFSSASTAIQQSSEINKSFVQSINDVSSIQLIPQIEFDNLQDKLNNLKIKIDRAKPEICKKE